MAFPTPDPDSGWQVVQEGFDAATNRHWESILALGTGRLQLRSSIDEGFDDDPQNLDYDWVPGNTSLLSQPVGIAKWGTYLPALFARHPYRRVSMVNLPHFLGLAPRVGDERLDLRHSRVAEHRRWLDLRGATLYRSLLWYPRAGGTVAVRFLRFCDPARRFVCVQRCELELVDGTPTVATLTAAIDTDVRTNGHDAFVRRRVGGSGDDAISAEVVTDLDNRVVTVAALAPDDGGKPVRTDEERRVAADCELALAPGRAVGLTKVAAVVADIDFPADGLRAAAEGLVAEDLRTPVAELHRRHAAWWEERWADCDVEIDADDPPGHDSQLGIRQAVYHLLRAKAEDDDRNLVDPKGLIGDIYYGAAFWDMEIFINPFFIYTRPATARTAHAYRARHLPRARNLAASYGYGGARYPWMQAPDGDPVVSLWQYADHQIHVTADVVIGLWHYVQATGDYGFLFAHGAELVLETARYWRERAETVPGREGYHIYGVMGPDEYTPLCNDNAYTNFCARFNLRLAGAVVELMGREAPAELAALRKRLNLTDAELDGFAAVADGLVVPVDAQRGIIWQCDGFETAFVELDIDAIWKDRSRLFGSYLSQERLFRSKALKQSDVCALLGVFPASFGAAQRAASFDYYRPFTIHDSSNSICHHQLVAAGLGRAEEAWEAWLESLAIDFADRPRAGDGVHCANVGGLWQEVVFGFAGMSNALEADRPCFVPCLPERIGRIAFGVRWRGRPLRVELTRDTLRLTNRSDAEFPVAVGDEELRLAPGESVAVGIRGG